MAQQHGNRRSKSPRYADLPDWAKPDSGHKPPSAAANKKASAGRAAAKGGAANPSVGATPAPAPAAATAPINKTTYVKSPSDLSYKPAAVSSPAGGSAQVVLVLVVLMLVIAEWNIIITPFASTVWSGTATTINWKSGLGLAVFGLIIVFMASINDDLAGLMMIVVLGMLAVYMVENKGGAFTTFFTWLQAPASSSSSSTPPPVKTGANPTGATP